MDKSRYTQRMSTLHHSSPQEGENSVASRLSQIPNGLVELEEEFYFLVGADREKFLNSYNTQDILKMREGDFAPGVFLTQKGKIVSPSWIAVLPEKILLFFPRGYANQVEKHLQTFLLFADVQFKQVPANWSHQVLLGEAALEFKNHLGLTSEAGKAQILQHREGDQILYLLLSDRFGAPGVELFGPSSLVQSLLAKSKPLQLDLSELDALRIQAGLPKMGVDMGEENLVAEVGLDRSATSFNKGCYLGQETTARVNSMGHVNKKLQAFQVLAPRAIPLPAEILQNQKKVGQLTSLALREADKAVGLGIVQRTALEASDPLYLQDEKGTISLQKL